MKIFEGYSIMKELPGNELFAQYLAKDLSNGNTVFLKTLGDCKSDFIVEEWNSRLLIKEYETSRLLAKKGITPSCSLREIGSSEVLVYNIGTDMLFEDMMVHHTGNHVLTCQIAVEICRQLELSHERGFPHYNLNPRSIVVNGETKSVRFINYCTIANYNLFCELAYIAPEQTGKLTIKTDYRCDFYSMGMMMYETVVGIHPIKEKDSKTVTRRQITDRFASPNKLVSSIPTAISDIIDKLTAKQASSRYQNATSLKYDLLKAMELIENGSPGRSFGLGSLDYTSNIAFPKPNIFFEREKDEIINTVKNAQASNITLINIPGSLSQGKDDFMRDIIRLLDEKNIFNVFVTALSINKDLPYHTASSLIREMAHVMRNSSTFDKTDVKRFFYALPNQLSVSLLKLCPHFSILFDIAIVQKNDFIDDRSVVCAAVRQFINYVTSKTRPLVVYVENVEFIDAPSTKLFVELQNEGKVNNFIFIQSTREPIAPPSKKNGSKVSFQQYNIPELSPKKTLSLVKTIFKMEGFEAENFTRLIQDKTKGKITQVNAFLQQMIELRYITFDRELFCWSIDEQGIARYNYEARYHAIINNKFEQLNHEMQHLLVECACIGYTFDICLLQKIHGYNIRSLSNIFREIISLGLVEPIEKFSSLNNANNPIFYKFKNIKIYEFFCDLISEEDKGLLGNLFSCIIDSCNGENNYLSNYDEFVKNNQTLLPELLPYEIHEVMMFYFKKADRFFYLNKRKEAERYITYCLSITTKDTWIDKRSLAYDVHLLAIKILSSTFSFIKSDQVYADVLKYVDGDTDRVPFLKVQAESLLSRGRYDEATIILASLLTIVGYKLPRFNLFEKAKHMVAKTFFNNKLFNDELVPDHTPSRLKWETLTFVNLKIKGVNEMLYQFTLHRIRVAILSRGIHPTHYMPLLVRARQLQANAKTFDQSIKMAVTVIDLLITQAHDYEDELHFYFVHFAPFTGRLSHLHCSELINTYSNQGCISKATSIAQFIYCLEFFKGKKLDILKKEIRATITEVECFPGKAKLEAVLSYIESKIDLLSNQGSPREMITPLLYARKRENELADNSLWNNISHIVYFFLVGELERVEICKSNVNVNTIDSESSLPQLIANFYEGISCDTNPGNHVAGHAWSSLMLRQFAFMAKHSPANFRAPYLILLAEKYSRQKWESRALATYSEALKECEKNEMYHLHGLASLRLAAYFKAKGNEKMQQKYIVKAYIAFKCWGAELVVEKIKLENLSVFAEIESRIYTI